MKPRSNPLMSRPLAAAIAWLLILITATAYAQLNDRQTELVNNMMNRFAQVHQLRTSQKAGEHLDGQIKRLEAPQAPEGTVLTPGDEAILKAENDDRLELYGLLAKAHSTTVEQAGKIRAEFIREKIGNQEPCQFWFQQPTENGFVWKGPRAELPATPPRYILTGNETDVFSDKSISSDKLKSKLPLFTVLKSEMTKEDMNANWYNEWYKVEGAGWVQKKDVLDWNHRLVARFASRDGRGPVAFLDSRKAIENLGGMAPEDRDRQVAVWRTPPVKPPVLALEPKITPDQRARPYLIPILSAPVSFRLKGVDPVSATQEAQVFELASNGSQKPGPDNKPKGEKMDIVFVMDTTGTMQPYINALVKMAKEAAVSLSGDSGGDPDRFRFGFWGYQDDPKRTKGEGPPIQYPAENFTKELQTLEAFSATLGGVKANVETRDEPEEDVLLGLSRAIIETKWRGKGVVPIIVHCGDAPPHSGKSGRQESLSRLLLDEVREHANERKITVISLLIKNPRFAPLHAEARRTFSALARNRGKAAPAFWEVEADKGDAFETKCRNAFLAVINALKQQVGETKLPIPQEDPEVTRRISEVMQGAFADMEGSDNPGVVQSLHRAWSLSRDPSGERREALEKCVVLSRKELDNLRSSLARLNEEAAVEKPDLTSLKNAVALAIIHAFTDPSVTMNDEAAIRATLATLPVKTSIMEMTNEAFAAMGPDERRAKIDFWIERLNYYKLIWDDTTLWFAPSENAPEKWTAIRTDMFP